MEDKKQLRRLIRERKARYSKEQLAELSVALSAKILLNDKFKESKVVVLYSPLPDEVDVSGLFDKCGQKTILLPRVIDSENMEMCVYNGRESLKVGAYGILEPCGEAFHDYQSIEMVVVPGMSFDESGNRLGRGKGYYDRFLSKVGQAYKLGVCFPFQVVDRVPTEPNDVVMDAVVSKI